MSDFTTQELRSIGFNNDASFDGRTFHVQTEIMSRSGLVVRTTVYAGGVIRASRSTPCEKGSLTLAALTTAARTQHETILAEVSAGKVG